MSQRIQFCVRATKLSDKARKITTCEAVIGQFAGKIQADRTGSVICLIDNEDCPKWKCRSGSTNRGVHMRLGYPDDRDWIPEYFYQDVWPDSQKSFDSVVYVHGSTATDDIGLTLTLAHELQHFVQITNDAEMMRVNMDLKNLPELRTSPATVWSDFPIEREARTVAKQVAEEIYGDDVVKSYLERQVRERFADANDWQFVANIDTSCPYDVSVETKLMADKFGLDHPAEME